MKKIYLSILFAISFVSIYAQCPIQIQHTNVQCFGQCNGTAQAFGTGNGLTYVWAPGGQTTNSISGLCAGTYTVTVTNNVPCTNTATVTITQPNQLVVTTTGQNPSNCINCNGMVIASASGGSGGPYTYLWMPTNCNQATCTGLCAGTYTCTATDANGCTATSTWTITSIGAPIFGVSSTAANNPNCNNGTATATVSGPGTFTYSWSPTSQTNSTATGLMAGIYTVCVTNTGNGCSACQPVTVNCTTGIVDHELTLGANIYPNPASTNFTLEFSGDKTGEMNVKIYNIVGEEMYSQQINVARSLTKQIDVTAYSKGIYFVSIKGAEGTQTMKLIVN